LTGSISGSGALTYLLTILLFHTYVLLYLYVTVSAFIVFSMINYTGC